MIPINPYLEALQAKYTAMQESISGVMTRAATEKRDLTDLEFRSLKEQSDLAKEMAEQIESLSEIETRNQKVAETGARVAAALATGDGGGGQGGGGQGGSKVEPLTGNTSAKDRDPGFYTRTSQHSFFQDLYRTKENDDDDAKDRLRKHSRAGLETGVQGVGVVAPKWLTDEFETLARQGRILANAVRNIGLGDDPRPMTLPKQTAGTDAVVAEQPDENDPVAGTDAWASDVDVVAPKATAGKQLVSRQMVDMASPAIDQLIYGDLMAVYNHKVEMKVGAAMIAAAGTAVVSLAEAAFTDAAALDAVIDTATAVRVARKLPPNIMAMTIQKWAKFKKFRDSDGRPLVPAQSHGPANAAGIGSILADGEIEGLPVLASEGMGDGIAYPQSIIVARSTDTLLFESNIMRFRFEEQAGPESIVLGIWGYTAVIVRQAGKSVKRITVTV